jgi:hypothetical protein
MRSGVELNGGPFLFVCEGLWESLPLNNHSCLYQCFGTDCRISRGGKGWKLSQAKKVALRVSSSKLDFEAWEIWHQKVGLVKLFSSGRHANGDILETLHHCQYSTLTCLNSLLSDQSCEVY